MTRQYRNFTFRLINILVLLAICMGYHQIVVARNKEEAKIEAKNSGKTEGLWKDGTYSGSGKGFGGDIKVNVTIENGSMKDITIAEANNEDTAYLENAKKILQTMMQKQTSDVDVATGATYSSKGIIEAVANALKEATN